jgi:hypothetical protein
MTKLMKRLEFESRGSIEIIKIIFDISRPRDLKSAFKMMN